MDLDFLELRANMLKLKEMMKLLMLHRGLDPSSVFKEEEDKEESVVSKDDEESSRLIALMDDDEISSSSLKNTSCNLVNQVKKEEFPRLREEEGVVSIPHTISRNPNQSIIQALNVDLGEKEQTRLQESNEYLKLLINLKKTKQTTIVSEFDSQINFLSDKFTVTPSFPRDSYTRNLTNEMKHQLLNLKDCVISLYSKYEVLRCVHKVFDGSLKPNWVGNSDYTNICGVHSAYWSHKPPKPPDYSNTCMLQSSFYSTFISSTNPTAPMLCPISYFLMTVPRNTTYDPRKIAIVYYAHNLLDENHVAKWTKKPEYTNVYGVLYVVWGLKPPNQTDYSSISTNNEPLQLVDCQVKLIDLSQYYLNREEKSFSFMQFNTKGHYVNVKTEFQSDDFRLDGVVLPVQQNIDEIYKDFVQLKINGLKLGGKFTIMRYRLTGPGKSQTVFEGVMQQRIVCKSLIEISGKGDEEIGEYNGKQVGVGTSLQ